MDQLLDILQHFTMDEMSDLLKDFVAAAGLLMAYTDGKKDKSEEEYILSIIGRFCIHPIKVLKATDKLDIKSMFEDTTKAILEKDPGRADELLHYLIDVALADGKLAQDEVDFIYDFGDKIGLTGGDVTVAIAETLQEELTPLVSALN